MQMKFQRSLFIFRRDLRLHDNTALLAALKASQEVILIFIVDKNQVSNQNIYKSNNCIQFMIESLKELAQDIQKKGGHLYFFYGEPAIIVKKLLQTESIDAVFINKDYTPYSLKRDEAIKQICHQTGIELLAYDDILLNAPGSLLNGNNEPYLLFAAYYKKALQSLPAQPIKNLYKNFYNKSIKSAENAEILSKKISIVDNNSIWQHGGRKEALRLIKNLKQFKNYQATKDILALNTTHLSPHNKFGTVSIREVFYAMADEWGKGHPLIRQLYWRDFFTMIAYFSPFVYGQSFNKKYNSLKWSSKSATLKAWQEGKTGFPIVDAAMRQLNETGYMHNRARLIVGSFLVKDLHISWLEGERYFAQKLIDYDPAVNNGNWQWVASTGSDATPYFRIFNPWLQQKKFDPECIYIKKWLPELKKVAPKDIHTWFKSPITIVNYPRPIVDHAEEAQLTKKLYKEVSNENR